MKQIVEIIKGINPERIGTSDKLLIDLYQENPEFAVPDSYVELGELERLEVIRGYLQGADIHILCDVRFDSHQLYQIRRAMSTGLDYKVIYDPKYSSEQMAVIVKGMKRGIDVTPYCNPKFNVDQMNEIMIGIMQGIDVSQYANVETDDITMRKTRNFLLTQSIKEKASPTEDATYRDKLKDILGQ